MFIAYEVSVQLVSSLRELVPLIERSDRDLADQLRRAASQRWPSARVTTASFA